MPALDIESLKQWFLSQKRDLPWRNGSTPYAVLISEVMLQQTQVSVVIPYFLKWMEEFPSFEALAKSTEEKVLKCWEGLGYYSRAKNLRKAAAYILENGLGSSEAELLKIPGIGPYTAGAIRAFAFREKAAAVDGNVIRVLSRYFAIGEDVGKLKVQGKIRDLAAYLLPDHEPWIITEALIELGALVCKKTPHCEKCPLKLSCKAFLENKTADFPVRPRKTEVTKLFRTVLVFVANGKILIRKVPPGEVMAGLHEFPYFEKTNVEEIQGLVKSQFQLDAVPIRKFPIVEHGFTRYRASLEPVLLACGEKEVEGYFWALFSDAKELPFSSGHKRILKLAS